MSARYSHPTAAELVEAVADVLRSPAPVSGYERRVAVRALEIVGRELREVDDPASALDRDALALALRDRTVTDEQLDDVRAALLAEVTAAVRIASPDWLARYRPDPRP